MGRAGTAPAGPREHPSVWRWSSPRVRSPLRQRHLCCAPYRLSAGGVEPTDRCATSTAHDRFREWVAAGVFLNLWQVGVERCDELQGIDWDWLRMDGVMTKAPLGGKNRSQSDQPWEKGGQTVSADRGAWRPLRRGIDGAHRQAMNLVRETLECIVVERPTATAERPQGMCLDKGDDDDEVRATVRTCGFTAHMRRCGEEAKEIAREAGKRAWRWVVERSHSWLNRFRRLLIRWEKKPEQYLAFLHVACGLIALRAAGLFG